MHRLHAGLWLAAAPCLSVWQQAFPSSTQQLRVPHAVAISLPPRAFFSAASSVVAMETAALTLGELVTVTLGLTWIPHRIPGRAATAWTTDPLLTLISDQAAEAIIQHMFMKFWLTLLLFVYFVRLSLQVYEGFLKRGGKMYYHCDMKHFLFSYIQCATKFNFFGFLLPIHHVHEWTFWCEDSDVSAPTHSSASVSFSIWRPYFSCLSNG